jgi:hypothetical protein
MYAYLLQLIINGLGDKNVSITDDDTSSNNDDADRNNTVSLSVFGFIYGTFPTAPGVSHDLLFSGLFLVCIFFW